MANDLDAMASGSLKISNEVDNKFEVVDNKTQGMYDSMGGVSNRARGVEQVQVAVNEIEISGVDGTQAILDNLSTVSLSASYI